MSRQEYPRELELISAAVHELKTPLTVIQGTASMLISGTSGKLTQQQLDQIARISHAGSRIHALINSLLHLENLPYILHTRPVQLHGQLQAVLQEIEQTAGNREVTVVWRLRRTLPPVLADVESIYQVLVHAMTAIVKHAPAGSEISVRTRRQGGMVVLHIDAPGEPITASEVRHITRTVGTQLQPMRAQGGSSGLSWYVVKTIVDFYEGSLAISTKGGRTVVSIRLPVSNQLSLFPG